MKASGRRGLWLATGIAAVLGGWGLAPAGAEEKLDSFAGSCTFRGTVTFSPPATNTQQSLDVGYDASGTCSGTLNGRQVSDVPVGMRSAVREVDGSCRYANTTKPGRGALRFPDGTTIPYTFGFNYVLTDGILTYHGEQSGTARAHGSFLTPRTSPNVSSECAGAGVSEIQMDVQLITESPLVGKAHGGQDDRRSGPGRANGRLKLVVRPRRVRAGRRTTFAFRVATADGRSASGAKVRFAGRSARAGRTGRVRIAATSHRPGRRTARASKPGFKAARATIRVHRR
jgi:hypothetical protein